MCEWGRVSGIKRLDQVNPAEAWVSREEQPAGPSSVSQRERQAVRAFRYHSMKPRAHQVLALGDDRGQDHAVKGRIGDAHFGATIQSPPSSRKPAESLGAGTIRGRAEVKRVIRSMTGFGAATADVTGGRFAVEIRSVNHRFSEVQVRLPRDLGVLEERVRALVMEQVRRGRVEVIISRDNGARRPRVFRADMDLAASYTQALRELATSVGVSGEITLAQIAALPDVLRLEEDRVEVEAFWPAIEEAVRTAIGALVAMRVAEGARLADDVLARAGAVERMAGAISARSRGVVQAYGERLRGRLADLLGETPVDEPRIAAEIAVFADRCDITEELTRLRSHLEQFCQVVTAEEGAVGRKLEFILQEMGRETNTIGSKANDLEITRAVIEMKGEIESLREQIQNIE